MEGKRRTKVDEWRTPDAVLSDVALRGQKFQDGGRFYLPCTGLTSTGWTRREPQKGFNDTDVPQKTNVVVRQESAETQDYVSCQDMDVDGDTSLEELGFVPSAVGDLLRVKHMCDKKSRDKRFKFS